MSASMHIVPSRQDIMAEVDVKCIGNSGTGISGVELKSVQKRLTALYYFNLRMSCLLSKIQIVLTQARNARAPFCICAYTAHGLTHVSR